MCDNSSNRLRKPRKQWLRGVKSELGFAKMSLRPNNRADVRKKGYKIGVDAEEARRRREDNMVEIRKNKREDNLLKKRREGLLNNNFQQLQQQFPLDPSQSPAVVEKKVIVVYHYRFYLVFRWL